MNQRERRNLQIQKLRGLLLVLMLYSNLIFGVGHLISMKLKLLIIILSLPKLEYTIDVVDGGHYHSYRDSEYRDAGYQGHQHNSYKR